MHHAETVVLPLYTLLTMHSDSDFSIERFPHEHILLSPPVHMHGGLLCIAFCMYVCMYVCMHGFTQGTLYTTTTVYGVLVHQEGAICTTKA